MNEPPPHGAPAGPPGQIEVALPGQLTVQIVGRTTDSFYVFRHELTTLKTNYNSIYGVLFGAALGVCVSLAISLLTAELGAVRPWFVAFLVAFGLLSVALFALTLRDHRAASQLVNEIMSERKLTG